MFVSYAAKCELFMKKSYYAALLLAFASTVAYGQRYLGVATGNYNTLNTMYVNPANLGGCNEKIGVNLFSFNMGVDNSLGTISSIGNIMKTLNSGDSGSTQNIFTYSNREKFSMMLPAVEIRGPGVLYRINSSHTVALTTRVRAINEFNNFDRTLYKTITQPSLAAGTNSITAQNFNWTAHLWSEIGFSYGGVIVNTDPMQVKVGATVRYLMGIGYLGLKGKNLDVAYTTGSDSFRATNSDIEFGSNAQSLENAVSNGITTDKLFGGESGGTGFGADLGVVISLMPEEGKGVKDGDAGSKGDDEGYKLSLSASITDIGAINYKTSYNVNVTGNGYLTGKGLSEHIKDYQDFRQYVITQGYSADTGIKATKVYLPTSLIIGGDYHAYKHFYANASLILNLASDARFGSKYYNQFTITPRYDTKILTVGLPITFNMLTNNMRMGIGFRVTGFFFGSDDMLALFSNNQYGLNFYVGGMVPICRGKK